MVDPLAFDESLASALTANDDRNSFRPSIFDCSVDADRARLSDLVAKQSPNVYDTLEEQLEELVTTLAPSREFTALERTEAVHRHLNGRSRKAYGRWVYFPWSQRLVHLLPPDEYLFLRSDRNRYKITPGDQDRLRKFTIGIVGLSVGQASAVTLAMEGVGGRFRLADFDVLSLSNMNRIRASAHEIGVRKTVMAARAMLEIDPYLDVQLFSEGLNGDNLDAFFMDGGKLDLLVEESDDLFLKLRIREQARSYGVPVIMETSDRGLVDVERFDREPRRPILHGLLGELEAGSLRRLSTKDKVPYVLRILDDKTISDAFAASLVEVKESIYTWPQLASGVALGGALVTDIARRLLLGEFTDSGRYYVDVETIVSDGKAAPLPVLSDTSVSPPSAPPAGPLLPSPADGTLTAEEAKFLASYGILAPSGGNQQPWRFEFRERSCLVFVDASRSGSFLDYESSASTLAVGAAVENTVRAARFLGFDAHVTPFPDGGEPLLVARIEFVRTGMRGDPSALRLMRDRVTNRRRGDQRQLSADDLVALEAAGSAAGVDLRVATHTSDLTRISQILGRCDRLRFLSKVMHSDLMSELRWTNEEARATRTGIDLPSLELSPSDEAAMRVLSRWSTMARLKSFGGGRALEDPARKLVPYSAAVCLLSISGSGPGAYFEGGRGVQCVWLEATRRAIALQPYSSLVFLLARLEQGQGRGLEPDEIRALTELRAALSNVFPTRTEQTELFLFRLAYAGAPTSRAPRLPLDDLLKVT